MTLERVADDIDDATHTQLDKRVLEIIDGETYSLGYLLISIVSTSEGKLDSTYIEPSKVSTLLREHPTLKIALKKAWEEKSFKDIRILSMLYLILPWRIGTNVDTEILRPIQGLCYCWLTHPGCSYASDHIWSIEKPAPSLSATLGGGE